MNVQEILETIESGVEFVEKLTPLASTVGGPIVGAVQVISTVTQIAHNVIERANDLGVAFSESDQAVIASLNKRLAAENDKLAEAINKS